MIGEHNDDISCTIYNAPHIASKQILLLREGSIYNRKRDLCVISYFRLNATFAYSTYNLI